MTTREALEAALVATPDDAALHSAYADLLLEEGDPRGEYIRLQLAYEDRNQPASKLRELEDTAHKMRQQHAREWLGDLWQFTQRPPSARSVAEPIEPNVDVSWRRGWIDGIRIWQLSNALVAALAAHPLTRTLRSFVVEQNVTADGEVSLHPLLQAGRFRHLRTFELGSADGPVLAGGFESDDYFSYFTPTLESYKVAIDHVFASELLNGKFPNLHTVEITSNNGPLDLEGLADNPHLPRLCRLVIDQTNALGPRGEPVDDDREPYLPATFDAFFLTDYLKALSHLTLRLPDFADAGVEYLLDSGFITRLKGLDLCRCNITDDGAQMLADHPHVRNLGYLHLDNNLLSPIGIDALEASGYEISPNQMFTLTLDDPDEVGGRE